MGLRKLVSHGSCKDLHKELVLVVDGRKLDLPPVEGIIILNILSWASGANPWGTERDETFQRPNHHDGMLEILGVNGVVHMGQIQTGLRSGLYFLSDSASNPQGRLRTLAIAKWSPF